VLTRIKCVGVSPNVWVYSLDGKNIDREEEQKEDI